MKGGVTIGGRFATVDITALLRRGTSYGTGTGHHAPTPLLEFRRAVSGKYRPHLADDDGCADRATDVRYGGQRRLACVCNRRRHVALRCPLPEPVRETLERNGLDVRIYDQRARPDRRRLRRLVAHLGLCVHRNPRRDRLYDVRTTAAR